MKINRFQEFNESARSAMSLWRNTDLNWLRDLVTKRTLTAPKGKFISLSLAEDSGGQDDFGDTCIEFDYDMVFEQGAREVGYDPDFMEQHPDICLYVTGYTGRDEYDAGEDDHLDWETLLEDYAQEEEVVLTKLSYKPGIVKSIYFTEGVGRDRPDNPELRFLNGTGIKVKAGPSAEPAQ